MQELRYAALLHDFGKVAVQEKVLRQGEEALRQPDDRDPAALRLHPQGHRGRPPPGAARGARVRGAPRRRRSRRSTPSTSASAPRRSACSRRCCSANEPTVVEEESFRALMNLPTRDASRTTRPRSSFPVEDWAAGPLPQRGRGRGAVDPQGQPDRRRSGGRSRATSRTPTSSCRRSRGRASSGASPRSPGPTTRSSTARATRAGSTAPEIPVQSRMMTIADIYDALVAWDRPYKKAVPAERALEILQEEAQEREAGPRPPRRVPRGEDLRAAGVQGPAHAEGLSVGRATPRHRPPGRLGAPAGEHARLFRGRPRGRSEPRRAGRAAHRGRPRDRHPRPRPRPDHHRPRRRPPADAGRGPVGVGGLPGPFRERLRGRAGPRSLRGPRAPARAGEGPRGDQGRVGDGRRRGRHRGTGGRRGPPGGHGGRRGAHLLRPPRDRSASRPSPRR